MKCNVCLKETNYFAVRLRVGSFGTPRDATEVLVDVCSKCGTMKLRGAQSDFMKKLVSGRLPDITSNDISKINVQEVLDQMVLPGRFIGERKVWIDPVFANHGKYGQVREEDYQSTFNKFKGNISALAKDDVVKGKYSRLIHFLAMDEKERKETFGDILCPALDINNEGHIAFKGGYHRFTLLRFLGANRIPVAMTQESIRNARNNGIQIWT